MNSKERALALYAFTLEIAQSEDSDVDRMVSDALDRMCLDLPEEAVEALAKEWRPIVLAIVDSRGPK